MVKVTRHLVPPQELPPHASVDLISGRLHLNWMEEAVRPSSGKVLAKFAALAPLGEAEAAPSIVALVQRFGPLHLCSEHKATRWSLEHRGCVELKPEPLSLWLEHARRVDLVLRVKAALDSGVSPTVELRNPDVLGEREVNALINTFRFRLQKIQRSGGASEEEVSEEFIKLDEWERENLGTDARRKREEGEFQETLPTTVVEWWSWVADEVLGSLCLFPTMIGLELDPDRDGVRPIMFNFGNLLARVYYELALEVSGVNEVLFCSACQKHYTREGRRPKRGQRHYCPVCRSTGARKRISAQEMRGKK